VRTPANGKRAEFAAGKCGEAGCVILGLSSRSLPLRFALIDRVAKVVKLAVYFAKEEDFFAHPRVANAASELFRDLFGAEKLPVRIVFGVASLLLGMPVELDVVFEVKS
jgi:enamine deaminase RidA (YjgF/YER057c/UK114 family)